MHPSQKSNLKQNYESWEPVLDRHFKEIDIICQKFYAGCQVFGISPQKAEPYLKEKLTKLILESVGEGK